jgi:hypothetical protein
MMFELLLKVMEACLRDTDAEYAIARCQFILLGDTAFEISSLQPSVQHTCTNHTVPYGTALLGWRCPRHFVPGYDHAVPLGRNSFRAETLIKLFPVATTQLSLGSRPIRLRSRYSDRLRAPLKPGAKAKYLNPARLTRRLGGTMLFTLTHSLTRL